MRLAYAWEDGKLVGAFNEEGGRVGFRYLPAATHPISLSLPLSGGWAEQAPLRFLEGLLPDNESERSAMMLTFGARSLHPMDLLISADATGGLCFTEDDSAPADRRLRKQVATPREVALKISRLALDRGSWQSDDQRSRFSLAGSQNKFSLGRYGSRWVWPNAKYPSTHIIKPDNARFPDTSFVEFATMELAARCGIPAARPEIVDSEELQCRRPRNHPAKGVAAHCVRSIFRRRWQPRLLQARAREDAEGRGCVRREDCYGGVYRVRTRNVRENERNKFEFARYRLQRSMVRPS